MDIEATVLEVKLESLASLRADSPSRVRALARAGRAALDCGRCSGSELHLGVAGATRCLVQPVFTPTAATCLMPSFRMDRAERFTRDTVASR
jgi:hypothetical protein